MGILNATTALALFCQAANRQVVATQAGDYQAGNKAHKQLIAVFQWLETHEQPQLLIPYLASSQLGECLWAASYLLLHQYPAAEAALQELASQPGILGFNAELTLREWRAGRLASFW